EIQPFHQRWKLHQFLLLDAPRRKHVSKQLWTTILLTVSNQRFHSIDILPARRQNSKTLLHQHRNRRITFSHLVMPRANNDVFWNHIDCASRSVLRRFPLTHLILLTINQSIAPHQHFDLALSHEVLMKFVNGMCKQRRRILTLRRRRLLGTKQKHFIHTDVNRVGTKRIDDLVHETEDDAPDFRIRQVPLTTVNAFVVWERSRREIKFRIDREQWKRLGFPRLVAQRLKLRDQSDIELFAPCRKLSRALARDRIRSAAQLGMRLKIEIVIDLENDHVDSLPGERLEVLPERIEGRVSVVVEQMDRTPGFRILVHGLDRRR